MVRTKTGQKIPLEKVQATLSQLEQLEEKAKEELSLRESIYFLREKLQSALKKGYTYQDLSEILAQQEIKISAATLKQYLTEIEKEKRSRQRGGKSTKTKQTDVATENLTAQQPTAEADAIETAEVAVNQQESSATTKKKASGRGSKNTKPQIVDEPQTKDDIVNDFNQY